MADLVSNPFYQFVTDTGIIVPDVSTVASQVQSEWVNAFGSSLSLDPATPQGRIMEISVTERSGTLEICALMANQLNIRYATGQFLDGVASLFAVSRRGATHSYALCTVSGVPGTVIPAGSRVSNANGDIFVSRSSVTIPATGNNTVYFYAEIPGAIPAALNTITGINTPVDGWESVINDIVSAIFTGSDVESDKVFRSRVEKSRYSGISLLGSIASAINALDGIAGYALYENYTNENQTVLNEDGTESSVVLAPHSICLITNGGDDQELAATLLRTKSGGCGYTAIAGNSVTINTPAIVNGRTFYFPVTFNRPGRIDAELTIKVKKNTYAGSDLAAAIRDAVISWATGNVEGVDGITIGKSVSPFEIGAGISSLIPEILISEILICASGGTPGYTPLTVDAGDIVQISVADITVIIDGVTAPAAD